jgi:hypothetical protein
MARSGVSVGAPSVKVSGARVGVRETVGASTVPTDPVGTEVDIGADWQAESARQAKAKNNTFRRIKSSWRKSNKVSDEKLVTHSP